MLTWSLIEELETFDAGDRRVLSAYLDLDATRRVRRSYRVAFDDLVKETRERLPEPARGDLLREAASVQVWLEREELRGHGLAVFACAPRELWRAHVLPIRVPDYLAFEARPDIAPLLALMDENERYAVAVVDKERARLFTVFLGEIEESEGFTDLVPRKHDQGGSSQTRYQRHHEAHVSWHLKRVVQRLAELLRRRRFDRLILAGPQEATSELRHLLPRALAHRLVATIPAMVSSSEAEILQKTREVERQVEREVEERLIQQLLDVAGPAGRSALGVAPTLDALWADMVQTLVVADGVHLVGSECQQCGRLEPGGVAACPACGTATRPVHDLFHRAMARALEQAGSVQVVHGAAARRLLEVGGGMGALLRYPRPRPEPIVPTGREVEGR
jgi:peptide chain release factor subunit 1